jgi:hypothetical protein
MRASPLAILGPAALVMFTPTVRPAPRLSLRAGTAMKFLLFLGRAQQCHSEISHNPTEPCVANVHAHRRSNEPGYVQYPVICTFFFTLLYVPHDGWEISPLYFNRTKQD